MLRGGRPLYGQHCVVKESQDTCYHRVRIYCIISHPVEYMKLTCCLFTVMIVECALSLVLEADHLPPFAKRGGVLTPMTAFGDVLIERLKASGRITIESEVIVADTTRKQL
jgi:short subunit dehydrogenase-like uncharacterized protein